MGKLRKVLEATGLVGYRAEQAEYVVASHIAPPPYDRGLGDFSTASALSISTVYRAVQILATASSQLPIAVERQGTKMNAADVPSIVTKPALNMTRVEFIEQTVTSMATTGNAYWRLHRAEGMGVIHVEILPANEVEPVNDDGKLVFHYRGDVIQASDMKHLKLISLPGSIKGLGPIQAARTELTGALNLRDYANNWFADASIPEGVLTTDQALNKSDAETYMEMWDEGSKKGRRVRVMGKGLKFETVLLNPADAQWLENQQFTTTQMARLFGTPASLMLAAVEGSAMTYSNVEQDWIAFVRFTLMGYLRKIEDAFSELLVRGQTVRFNIEALLRTDTLTRYQAHGLALGSWMTEDEIRVIENLPPLTDAQREQLKASPPATPTMAGGGNPQDGEPA